MIPVVINFTETINEFTLNKEQANGLIEFVIKELVASAARNWAEEAKRHLKSTREIYLNSLIVVDEGKFKGSVILKGQFPNMIEEGASPFDMKEGFQKSSKVKISKEGGWYLSVPFRYATPEALGESSAFAGRLPEEVYGAIKGKQGAEARLLGSEVPEAFATPKTRNKIITKSATFEEYKNKTSIFSGLKKTTKDYESASQSTYTTFRRVSNNSDPNAFIHPGLEVRKFAERGIENMNIVLEVDKLTDIYLSRLE